MEETYNMVVKSQGKPHQVHEFDAKSWNEAFLFVATILPQSKWSSTNGELAQGVALVQDERQDLALFKKYSDVARNFEDVLHTYVGETI